MKTLYLVRHAKAGKGKSNLPDSERSLNKKGKNDAGKMAIKIKKDDALPDLLISSPAKRAIQTARTFAKTMNYPTDKILVNENLYKASGASGKNALLKDVRGLDDQYQSAMIFGHDPLLTEFAHYLGKNFEEALPSCGVVRLDFSNNSWSEVSKGNGSIKFFDYPNKQKKLRNEIKKDLESKIIDHLMKSLAEVNADAAQKVKKAIKKSGKDLSQTFFTALKVVEEQTKSGQKAAKSK